MPRTRQILSTLLASLVLLALAVPAQARPAPLDQGRSGGAGGGTGGSAGVGGSDPSSSASDPSSWLIFGYVMAAVVVVALIAVGVAAFVRHSHHAPHPA